MELEITMIPALEDPDERSPGYQRQLGEFARSLTKAGIEHTPAGSGPTLMTETAVFTYAGKFVVTMIKGHGPLLVTAIAAWLHGRSGRRARLKIDHIEAEAQTVKELKKILKQAKKIRRRDQPKAIRKS